MAKLCIGISGWRYAPWRGTFYPKNLPQKRELEHAASKLNSIEINGSFADFAYLRLHGAEELYVSGYTVYFDNDAKVKAPFDAMSLAAKLTG